MALQCNTGILQHGILDEMSCTACANSFPLLPCSCSSASSLSSLISWPSRVSKHILTFCVVQRFLVLDHQALFRQLKLSIMLVLHCPCPQFQYREGQCCWRCSRKIISSCNHETDSIVKIRGKNGHLFLITLRGRAVMVFLQSIPTSPRRSF